MIFCTGNLTHKLMVCKFSYLGNMKSLHITRNKWQYTVAKLVHVYIDLHCILMDLNFGITSTATHTHTRSTTLCLGLPRWAGTRKAKPVWILLKQETVSGSGISWAICKSASRSRQITMPAPHHSVFYRPDALPATQPTASKHWRQLQHSAL